MSRIQEICLGIEKNINPTDWQGMELSDDSETYGLVKSVTIGMFSVVFELASETTQHSILIPYDANTQLSIDDGVVKAIDPRHMSGSDQVLVFQLKKAQPVTAV